MFKHYFERIQGIELYPIISLLIFFIFFVLLFVWVVRADKKYINKMKHLPFEGADSKTTHNENSTIQ